MHSEFNIFYTKFSSYLRARTRYTAACRLNALCINYTGVIAPKSEIEKDFLSVKNNKQKCRLIYIDRARGGKAAPAN